MEDIIQKYKKEKRVKNISIIITSLALALGLNVFLSNTESGKYLKSSVMNSQIAVEKKSDLYLENSHNAGNILIGLKTSKEMTEVKTLSFSLAYNEENVVLKDKKIDFDNVELINVINNNGYNTVILNFKNPTNIKAGETIVKLVLEKKNNQNEKLNLLNTNMMDNDNNLFTLSSNSLDF